MERGRTEYLVISLEPGGNSESNDNVFQDHLRKRCSPMEKGRVEISITFLEPGGNSGQNGKIQYFST